MSGSFWADTRVLVTGAHGFLGSHVVDALARRGVQGPALVAPTSGAADLRDRATCERVVQGVDVLIHLAARTGGIGLHAERPGEVFHDSALMGLLLLEAARRAGVQKVVTVGTTCSYPARAPLPLREDSFWDGPSDPTTGFYGYAKKLLLVQGQAYRRQWGLDAIHLVPVNLFGPRDHFDPESGHVIPALIHRFVAAAERGDPQVAVWGSGRATREFLYAADAAEGILLAAERYSGADPVNLGSGREVPIREVVEVLARATGYTGAITWDTSKPDGQPRRCLDVSRARELFGFVASTPFEDGVERTVAWYRAHRAATR